MGYEVPPLNLHPGTAYRTIEFVRLVQRCNGMWLHHLIILLSFRKRVFVLALCNIIAIDKAFVNMLSLVQQMLK